MTGAWPICPVYHMAQAFSALHTAYDKAINANGGNCPPRDQVVDPVSQGGAGEGQQRDSDPHAAYESAKCIKG